MARSEFYRGCEIVSSPTRLRSDQGPNSFSVFVSVRLINSGDVEIFDLRPLIPEDEWIHSSEEAADNFSIEFAKSWIDNLLNQ